ncbi:MAG: sugar phosphate isomerase/epimerase [Verrucomicrobia bacterium]|nr:sugar phosphate isomerase/epimerase [Verrucomicrobiota bacterium]
MKLGMINSAWEQHGVSLVDGLRKTKELGFDCVDIFEDPMEPQAADRITEIKQTCDELELPIISVVGVSVGLVDFNPSVQRFHVERCKRYLDMGATFGAKNYLLVIGEYIWQKEVIPPEEQWRFAVENCRLLGDYAGERDLEIVIELEPFHMSLVNTIGEMDRFLTDVDNPAVKANIDISHMVLSDSPPESLAALKGRAGHVHISDCDGKVHGDLPPGRGAVPFEGYLQAIKDLDFDGAISLELEYAPDPSQIVEWVTEAYSATDRLMSAINLRN